MTSLDSRKQRHIQTVRLRLQRLQCCWRMVSQHSLIS